MPRLDGLLLYLPKLRFRHIRPAETIRTLTNRFIVECRHMVRLRMELAGPELPAGTKNVRKEPGPANKQ